MPKQNRHRIGARVVALSFVMLLVGSIFMSLGLAIKPASAADNKWINRGTIRFNDRTYRLTDRKAGNREVFRGTTESCTYNGTTDYKERYTDALLVTPDGKTVSWSVVDEDNVNTGGTLNCETKPEIQVNLNNPNGRHIWFYKENSTIYTYYGQARFNESPKKVAGATVYTSVGGNCEDMMVFEPPRTTVGGRWLFFPMETQGTMKNAFPYGRDAKSEDYRDYSGSSTAMDPGDGGCRVASQEMLFSYKVGEPLTWTHTFNDMYRVCGGNGDTGVGPNLPKWVGTLTDASPDVKIDDIVLACRFEEATGPVDKHHVTFPLCYNAPSEHCSRHSSGTGRPAPVPGTTPAVINALLKFNTTDFIALNGDNGYIVAQGVSDEVPDPSAPPIGLPGSTTAQPQCASAGEKLGWILCPVIESMGGMIKKLDDTVLCLLKINTAKIFNVNAGSEGCVGYAPTSETAASSKAYHIAWGVFRNFALALLVIFALIMVASQILGLEIFDAYTIRKMLPRLLVAVILLALSWNLMQFLFTMSNSAADAIRALIATPFRDAIGTSDIVASLTSSKSIAAEIIGGAAGGVGVVAGVGYVSVLGLGGVFAVVGSILLFVFSAWILLIARDTVATMLIIGAPVAIICSAFEPFQKVFSAWRGYLVTILLSVPIIAAIIQISHVAALITWRGGSPENTIKIFTALAILVAGYALIWSTFKKIDQVAGQLGSVIGNVTGGAQKALSNFRSETAKRRLNEGIEGRRNFGNTLFIPGSGWAGNRLAGMARRFKVSSDIGGFNAFGLGGRTGSAKYREATRTIQAGAAAKMMEQDHDRAGGDDDAMRLLARRGMTDRKFLREYADIQRRRDPKLSEAEATQRARSALGLSESSLGASVGTNAMRIAAQKSLLKSNTSYRRQLVQDPLTGKWKDEDLDFGSMTRTMYGDVAELVEDGLITVADGAAMIKSNGARADRAGVGFGSAMLQLERVATGGKGSLDAIITSGDNTGISHLEAMANEVLVGTGPGQLVGQRHEAVRILAPEMIRRAREAAILDRRPDGSPALSRSFIEQAAMAARYQDLGQQLPEMNAELSASGFLGERLNPDDKESPTMLQVVEFMRTPAEQNTNNQLYRQIYGAEMTRIHAEAVARGSIPAVGPLTQAQNDALEASVREATGRRVADAQRIFLEYRREYNTGYQAGRPPEPGAPVGGGGGIPGVPGP